MYITVYHTNGQSIKNTVGVIMNRLVGMGLKCPVAEGLIKIMAI